MSTRTKSLTNAVAGLALAAVGVGFVAVLIALPAYLALSVVLDPATFWERFALFASLAVFGQRAAEKAMAWGVQHLVSSSLKDALIGGLKEVMSRGPQGCEEAIKNLRADLDSHKFNA